MSKIRGTQCCVFGCAKRKKVGENKRNARSDSEGSDDEESAIKRQFSRSFHRYVNIVHDARGFMSWVKYRSNIHKFMNMQTFFGLHANNLFVKKWLSNQSKRKKKRGELIILP